MSITAANLSITIKYRKKTTTQPYFKRPMNITMYFRQAWELMRQNRIFTSIYIGGTALTLTLTTIYAVMFHVRLSPIYPEYKRGETAYINVMNMAGKGDNTWWFQSAVSYPFLRDHIYKFKNADKVSAQVTLWDGATAKDANGRNIAVNLKPTDPAFFDIYTFDFTQGGPFSESDFENGIRNAVVNSEMLQLLLGESPDNAIGRTISIDMTDYRICGVIRAGSAIHSHSYADIIVPYTSLTYFNSLKNPDPEREFLGPFSVVMTTRNLPALKAEMAEIQRKHNTSQEINELHVQGQPNDHLTDTFVTQRLSSEDTVNEFGATDAIEAVLPALLALLLIPALNLSGMISGRMESRLPELGVRKSFGATRGQLLRQVLWENLLFTLIGGAIGLVLTWIILIAASEWVLGSVMNLYSTSATGAHITGDMLFSPMIFAIMMALCVLLNIFSAIIPAWLSLRHPITTSLKDR